MILPFSTQLNGKPTYFVEKIQKALKAAYFPNIAFTSAHIPQQYDYVKFAYCNPKIHTIREDKKDRWKPSTKIDFFINSRQKNMFRFAPVLPVVSVQKIEIRWVGFSEGYRPWVLIDGKSIYTLDQIEKEKIIELAQNDGFDTVEEFFEYFNQDFTGKIIHWTDKRY